MAGRGWVHGAPYWHAHMGVPFEAWLEAVRAEGYRMTYGVAVRRWDGPGPEPPPTWGPGEGPAE